MPRHINTQNWGDNAMSRAVATFDLQFIYMILFRPLISFPMPTLLLILSSQNDDDDDAEKNFEQNIAR